LFTELGCKEVNEVVVFSAGLLYDPPAETLREVSQ
jgi:hypothetical protein